MTVSLDTANQLDALSATLCAATEPSSDLDASMLALIAPVMLAIDGRTAAAGFRYTLNITNALQLRPKHWYIELNEYNTANPNVSSQTPCFCGLLLVTNAPTGFSYSVQASGALLGLTAGAAICRAWAMILRQWLAGNYPLAVAGPAA